MGDAPSLSVVHQYNRMGELAAPKTPSALRRIPLSPSMVKFLAAHKIASAFSQPTDFVFASTTGEPMSHRRVQHGFERAAERAGITGATFHDCRHAFCSQMIAAGVSPIVLADLLGHSSSTITLSVYAHLFDRTRSDGAVRAAMEAAMGG
jgi:integrase